MLNEAAAADGPSTSTSSGRARPSRFRRSGGRSWSQEIETTTAALNIRVATIRKRPPPKGMTEAELTAICEGVEYLIDQALKAARGDDPEYRSFHSWWRGTSVEAAFRKSHQATSELVKLYSDDEVEAEVPAAVARAVASLNRDDPMREAARQLSSMGPGPRKRALLSKVVQVGYEAVDGSHTRLRNFRNILLSATFCIAVLGFAFSFIVAFNPTAVPLCFTSQETGSVACPTGDSQTQELPPPGVDSPPREPTPLDVIVVSVLGFLGGSLAAAVSIRNLRGTETPYDVPIALSLLKVPTGALTAVGALIAIRGEFVPGLSALDSQEQILAYALVFGYAQQLLTGLIDRRASELLGSVPSKDAVQNKPQLESVPAPTPPSRPPVPLRAMMPLLVLPVTVRLWWHRRHS